MHSVSFTKLWPGGNPTLLIDLRGNDQDQDLSGFASRLMAEPYLGGEQVGFLMEPTRTGMAGRLMMMGGELCINATRCAARIFAANRQQFQFEASGLPEPVLASVNGDMTTIDFDAPLQIEAMANGVQFVAMPGIGHFVRPAGVAVGRDELVQLIGSTPLAQGYSALGLIASVGAAQHIAIEPLIHVRPTNSWIWETACGSGSLAAVAVVGVSGQFEVTQPSGESVEIDWSAPHAMFRGPVVKTLTGEILLPLLPPGK